MTRYHFSTKSNEWLQCRAAKGHCPYGKGEDLTERELIEHARVAHHRGQETPVLRDTAGRHRAFEFNGDGSYSFGSRSYNKDGEWLPTDRTIKSWRLKEAHVADHLKGNFSGLTVERKLKLIGPALIRHEVTSGVIAGPQREARLKFHHWQDYTRQHHRGLFSWFFKSEWKQTPKEEGLATRYKLTLEGMFGKVRSWIMGGRKAA